MTHENEIEEIVDQFEIEDGEIEDSSVQKLMETVPPAIRQRVFRKRAKPNRKVRKVKANDE
jgi:hypothetical protein